MILYAYKIYYALSGKSRGVETFRVDRDVSADYVFLFIPFNLFILPIIYIYTNN